VTRFFHSGVIPLDGVTRSGLPAPSLLVTLLYLDETQEAALHTALYSDITISDALCRYTNMLCSKHCQLRLDRMIEVI